MPANVHGLARPNQKDDDAGRRLPYVSQNEMGMLPSLAHVRPKEDDVGRVLAQVSQN